MSDVLSAVLIAAGLVMAVLLGLLLITGGNGATQSPGVEPGEFRILDCETITPQALGDRPLSSYSLEELATVPRFKRLVCDVSVGTGATRESIQENVQTTLRDKTASDPDLDVLVLFFVSTADRTSLAYDVARAVWSQDGITMGVSPEVAVSNDRTGYVLNVDIREDLESYLALIRTSLVVNGLDERTRRAIFKAETVCEDAASWEAYKRYNAWCSRCQQFIKDDERLMFAYMNTYEAGCKTRLMQKYGIASDVLDAILLEGLEKSWPMSTPIPPPACCK
jgi:hypothetical protein